MKNFFVCLFLCLPFLSLNGQTQNPQWEYLSGSHQIQSIAHDGNILWFATEHYGVGRYNRSRDYVQYYNTENAPLSSNKIQQLHTTPMGDLWVQNEHRWLIFDGQNWRVFDETNSPMQSDIQSYDWAIAPNGTVYLAFAYGILTYNGETWHEIELPEEVRNSFLPQIAVDKNGDLWSSGSEQLFQLEGGNWIAHPFAEGTVLDYSWVSDLKIDSQQNIWLSLSGYYPVEMVTGGLVRYDGENWRVYESEISGVELNGRHLTVDAQDDVWVVSGFNGHLVHFDVDKEAFAAYHTPSGPNATFLASIGFDEAGQLWAGSNLGLQHLSGQQLEEVPIVFPEKWILQRLASRQQYGMGKIWFASFDGLVSFDGENWQFHAFEGALEVFKEGFGTVVPTTDGSFWCIAQEQIFECVNGMCTPHVPVEFTELHGKVNQGMEDRQGNIWFLVNKRQQLVYYNGSEWIDMQPSMEKLNINYGESVYALNADYDNNIWIGTNRGKLHKWDGLKWESFDLRSPNVYNYQPIYDIAVDKNNQLWLAQREHLKLFDGEEVIQQLTATNLNIEAEQTNFWDVQIDPSNNDLWVGTSHAGIFHFDGTDWTHFHHENSPLSRAGIDYLQIDPKGHKWITPQYNGFYIYHAEGIAPLNAVLDPDEEEDDHPDYELGENIPNPFVEATRIPIEMELEGWATIKIVDSSGRIVSQAKKEQIPIGTHYHIFDARTLDAGFYYYIVETPMGRIVGRMLKM